MKSNSVVKSIRHVITASLHTWSRLPAQTCRKYLVTSNSTVKGTRKDLNLTLSQNLTQLILRNIDHGEPRVLYFELRPKLVKKRWHPQLHKEEAPGTNDEARFLISDLWILQNLCKKSEAISVTGREGVKDPTLSRQSTQKMAVRLSVICTGRALVPRNTVYFCYSFLFEVE
jgi:hypothetical protein